MNSIETEIELAVSKMKTKDDFCHFLELLLQDYDSNLEFWQNQDLRSFLVGLQGYAEGEGGYMVASEGGKARADSEKVYWATFADMIAAARAFA
ncbi:MAG: hypothetical protein K2W95_10790 [Candidatus Obscuribacterales bacterium]|nr:hypothetical protein [Candidatus Obscuribacterales bacterium]